MFEYFALPFLALVLLIFFVFLTVVAGGVHNYPPGVHFHPVKGEKYIRRVLKDKGSTAITIAPWHLSESKSYAIFPVDFMDKDGDWQRCDVWIPIGGIYASRIVWDFDGNPFGSLNFILDADKAFTAQQAELSERVKLLRARGLL